jgi:glycosyltransferase involved in cell wall biosynthesis
VYADADWKGLSHDYAKGEKPSRTELGETLLLGEIHTDERQVCMDVVINGRFLTQRVTGVQRYARELVQSLDALLEANPDVRITVMSPRLSESPPAWRNIKLRQVGLLQGHAWEQFELPLYSRGKLLFCPGNTAPAISLLGSQPIVVTVHDLSYMYFPEAYRLAFRLWYGFIIPLVLSRASRVITVSESERQAILEHYPKAAGRLRTIANGGLPAAFSSGMLDPVRPSDGYILYVGSLSKRKNISRMLEVASRLARRRRFNFVFIGDVPKNLTTSAARIAEDVASEITFAGAVDDPLRLTSYYRNAMCLMFPSLYESSGLPPIEAMACGCPAIVSDIPALRERCGDAAIYCDPHDVESITAAVERIMDDPALRLTQQKLGYRRAAIFTWEHCARATLELICECADNAQQSSASPAA